MAREETKVELFKRRTLLRALEQMKLSRNFFMRTFFSEVQEFDTEKVDIDFFDGKRTIAPHTTNRGGPVGMDKQGFKTITTLPAHIFLEDTTEAEQAFDRIIGNDIYDEMTAVQVAAELASRDMMLMESAITRTEELMAVEALTTGVINLRDKDGAVFAEIDFQRETGFKGEQVAIAWDQSNSDPLKDIKDRRRQIHKKAGIAATDVVLGSEAADAFVRNEEVKTQLDNRRFSGIGQLELQAQELGLIFIGIIEGGIAVWEYEEYYVDPADNVEKQMFPTNGMMVGSRNADCRALYGAVKDDEGRLIRSRRFVHSYVTEKERNRMIQIETRPVPNPVQVNGFTFNKVLPDSST